MSRRDQEMERWLEDHREEMDEVLDALEQLANASSPHHRIEATRKAFAVLRKHGR